MTDLNKESQHIEVTSTDVLAQSNYASEISYLARQASFQLASITENAKNLFLADLSSRIIQEQKLILAENQKDLITGKEKQLSNAMLDRLTFTPERLKNLANSLQKIVALPDPIGEVVSGNTRPSGLKVSQERVPLGVVMVVFESRPNVTIDIAALCIKSGNAAILRGGKEAYHSNKILGQIIKASLKHSNLPETAVQVIEQQDRSLLPMFLKQTKYIDVVVPRGGEKLIKLVSEISAIPVIKHDKGLCHLYLAADAPLKMTTDIALNAKVQRPGVCNAIETMLVHTDFPYLAEVLSALHKAGVELRLDNTLHKKYPQLSHQLADDCDWKTEYLDLILSVKQVNSTEEAIEFINAYGSKHTEVIITQSIKEARTFKQQVDASAIGVNVSSRFNDGEMLGLGAEVGISTQKLHVRGPMGIRDLTCLKYCLEGEGLIRT